MTSLGYKDLVTFHSTDKRGKSVYHTNVMMAIGTDVAVVCAESVADAKERQNLLVSMAGWIEGACSCCLQQLSTHLPCCVCGNVDSPHLPTVYTSL